MKNLITVFSMVIFSMTSSFAQNATQLVSEMVDVLGGKQNYYNHKNVSYNYEYHNPDAPITLISKETYAFDGELSRGEYTEHSLLGANGKVLEGYDGKDAWVKFDGKISDDKQANGVARFLRKTNYYWFSMFFKLLDTGVNLEYIGSKEVEGREYNLVKVTFGSTVGDAQDTYVLYINKRTKLVDQFLFTVIGFGVKEPSLMKLHYETIDRIKVPSERTYIGSNWDGEIIGKKWTTTYWTNIKFNSDLDLAIFSK